MPNILTQAIQTDDLDAACLLIQNALGIADGGCAAVCFSGPRGKAWRLARPEVRADWIAEWLRSELNFAIPE